MDRRRLLTVILHYGSARTTARLHDQLLRQAGMQEIRVLDNAAPEKYPEAWHRLPENIFWAGALEWMLGQTAAEGFSHLWFLNNDIIFLRESAIAPFAWHRLDRIEDRTGRVAIYSPSVTSNPYHAQMVRKPDGDFRTVTYVDGIAPLISLDYWREAGLDRQDNPKGYGVDVWFSLRAPALGWNLVVDHALVMRHRYHETARSIPGFMAQAGQEEHDFLKKRLGDDYRHTLQLMSRKMKEY